MTPEARIWINLGRELTIRELTCLDEENRQTDWMRVDAIRDRAVVATNRALRERLIAALATDEAYRHIGLRVFPR